VCSDSTKNRKANPAIRIAAICRKVFFFIYVTPGEKIISMGCRAVFYAPAVNGDGAQDECHGILSISFKQQS
jgi:hypothetical protein